MDREYGLFVSRFPRLAIGILRVCIAVAMAIAVSSSATAKDAASVAASGGVSCREESESGAFLDIRVLDEATVWIGVRDEFLGDYPGFSAAGPGDAIEVRFIVDTGLGSLLAPAILESDGLWRDLPFDARDRSFTVPIGKLRRTLRLWSAGEPEAVSAPRAVSADAPGLHAPTAPACADACYANDVFCHDFERLQCHLRAIEPHPEVEISVLGWTRPCPGEKGHVPREIYKVRITDPGVPVAAKTRLLFTARVHGGERLSSFILEGLMDWALGYDVRSAGGNGLPPVPAAPADFLRKFDLVIYPMLNPDGSVDRNGDGKPDFSRYKCGVDMNRLWGTSEEETQAHEVHLVHQDILREAKVRGFAFHRDLHDWGRDYQGGLRHGAGIWKDAAGRETLSVSTAYVNLEAYYLKAQARRIPYRPLENFMMNWADNPPTPGTARFALSSELPFPFVSDTTESALTFSDGKLVSTPRYAHGDDLRQEGAWLLRALSETPFASAGTVPGSTVNLAPTAEILAISPETAILREEVVFTGAGKDVDGRVVAWRWTSDLDGEISRSASFRTNQLSLGNHTISFVVKDDRGIWSAAATRELRIVPAAIRASVIVDDGDPGTRAQGVWTVSTQGSSPFGKDSLYSRMRGAEYTFESPLATPGNYEVYLWWTSAPGRSEAVPVSIGHADGSDRRTVNQEEGGGQWNLVGSWRFVETAKVTVGSPGSESACADAVLFLAGSTSNQVRGPLVLEEDGLGVARTGTWLPSQAPSPHEGRSLYSKEAGASAEYVFSSAAGGDGLVHAWWTEWPSRAQAVPYEVVHAGGVASVRVDQRAGGGRWQLLGAWNSVGSPRIRIRSPGGATACADAVRWSPAPTPDSRGSLIVDDTMSGASFQGRWSPSSGTAPYLGRSLYTPDEGAIARFEGALSKPGYHAVYAWWTEWPSRRESAPYEVQHLGGPTTIAVDQRTRGGRWNLLGAWEFGSTATVILRSGGGGTVSADAVAFVPISP